MKKWMYSALTVFFVLIFVSSGAMVGYYIWDSFQQEGRYDELAQLRPSGEGRPGEGTDGTQPAETTEPQPTEPKYVEVVDDQTGESRQILQSFEELYKMNNHMVGWLRIPAIGVDYPVMHTPGDQDYYLKRNFDRKKSSRGTLFIQEEADVFLPSDNVVIYGHNMRDGTMFGKLDYFRSAKFTRNNPYIYFDTLSEYHTYEVLSVFLTTATLGKGFPYHDFVNAVNEEEFDAFVDKCKKLALFDTGVDAQFGDKLICLSTCEYSQMNGRLVVVAKRIN